MAVAQEQKHKPVKGFKSRALGLGNTIYTVDFYTANDGDGEGNTIDVKITCKDALGNNISTQPIIEVGVSSTNGGAPDSSINSAAITASGSGTEFVDIGTSGLGRYQLGADGVLDITLTDTEEVTFYLFVIDNDGYRYNWSDSLAFTT